MNAGPCVRCGAIDRYPRSGACRPCSRESQRRGIAADPDKHRALNRASYLRHRRVRIARVKEYIARIPRERKAQWCATSRYRLRAEFLSVYGCACRCCDETEPAFLTLDHINNDGAAHKRAVSPKATGAGDRLLNDLKRRGWPRDGYRVLCANCNFGRARRGGVCPHELRRVAVMALSA